MYCLDMTKLKKTSIHMTHRQLAQLAGVAPSTIGAWKRAGELDDILGDSGLIDAGKARAWVMRRVKRTKRSKTATAA